MSDVLVRIKRAVLAGHYGFSKKARMEMKIDGLSEMDVAESILNAVAIYKRIRSTSPYRERQRDYLYVIQSTTPVCPFTRKGSLIPRLVSTHTTF